MKKRFTYHFEVKKGWMNDPNGLIDFKGLYHAFYQHNPYAPKWDTMHWGHAVSKDLIHWEDRPIALYPDQPYENSGGCFSGSAIEENGRMYLFYTSVSKELGQTQSMAWSDDGVTFTKYEGNPIIDHYPVDGCPDFRDPKVLRYKDRWMMVLGSGKGDKGRVLWYSSSDLFHWNYEGILYESSDYNLAIECPDFFPLGDKYVLSYSMMERKTNAIAFVVGQFDGSKFTPESICFPEYGPQFYAPQTFEDHLGRRIQIAWWHSPYPELETETAGAFTIPRELTLQDNHVYSYPIEEAHSYFVHTSPYLKQEGDTLRIDGTNLEEAPGYHGKVTQIDVLNDGNGTEIFLNKGEQSYSFWTKEEEA